MCKKTIMASEILQRLTVITILLAVNAVSTILGQCSQDQTQAEDIICTVNRNALLPSPAVALVHCETDQPGRLLLKQLDAIIVANTHWVAEQKACFFRAGGSCTHFFLRIDSPLIEQEHINVCRFVFPVPPVCKCINLTETTPPTTISTDPPTTTQLNNVDKPSLDNSKGGVIEQNAVPVLVSVATALSAVIITLSVVLAVTCTCWCKGKTRTTTKTQQDIELASSK